ncbi:hypothetical protein [Polaromonas sp. YR568]|uniref:hypothetical protein n=1 Tax=Polaromonas sp. YR568 TaxID=1855301 RepID=UPI00398C1DEA
MSTHAVPPVALGPDFSAGLQALVRAAAQNGRPGALKAAMDDPDVHTLVLLLRLGEPPAAVLAGCLGAPDALSQWLDLSCI